VLFLTVATRGHRAVTGRFTAREDIERGTPLRDRPAVDIVA